MGRKQLGFGNVWDALYKASVAAWVDHRGKYEHLLKAEALLGDSDPFVCAIREASDDALEMYEKLSRALSDMWSLPVD